MNKPDIPSLIKKLIMTLAGLFLILFLLVHLSINLLLFKDQPESFNRAAHFMAHNPLIKIMELVLFTAFLLHIVLGIILQIQNWIARPVRYRRVRSPRTSFFSKYMIHTGMIILVFLIIHLMNFYFIRIGWVKGDPEDLYTVAHKLFKVPAYVIFYLISFVFLGFHLNHGFQSAFQTLGINSMVYSPLIRITGLVYSIVVPLGFSIIPVIIYFFK